MSANTLTTYALIEALDRMTGPMNTMARNVETVQGRMTKGWAGMTNKIKSMPLFGGGIIAAMAEGSVITKMLHADKAMSQLQAIGDLSDAQLGGVRDKLIGVSDATGASFESLTDGAKKWQQLGYSVEDYANVAQYSAKSSRITGMAIEDTMTAVNNLGRAFNRDVTKPAIVKHLEELQLVGSKLTGGGHALEESLKSFGPMAAALKMTEEQAIATIATVGGEFDASLIGNSFKSGFANLIAPSSRNRSMMAAVGIDAGTLFNVDQSKLSTDSLMAQIDATGMFGENLGPKVQAMIAADLEGVDLTQTGAIAKLRSKLLKDLDTGLGAKDGASKDVLAQTFTSWIGQAAQGMNVDEFFKQFGPLANNPAALREIFGKQNFQVFEAMLNQHQRYLDAMEKLDHAEGALDRKWGEQSGSLSLAFDKLKASWDNLFLGDNWKLVKRNLGDTFDVISGFLVKLNGLDPQVLNTLFLGVSALVAIPLAGFALGSVITGFETMIAVATLGATSLAGAAVGFGAFALAGVAIYEAWQHWPEIKGWLERTSMVVGDQPGVKALGDSLSKLGKALMDLPQAIDDGLKAIAKLFNFDPGDSPLLKALVLAGKGLDLLARGVGDSIDTATAAGKIAGANLADMAIADNDPRALLKHSIAAGWKRDAEKQAATTGLVNDLSDAVDKWLPASLRREAPGAVPWSDPGQLHGASPLQTFRPFTPAEAARSRIQQVEIVGAGAQLGGSVAGTFTLDANSALAVIKRDIQLTPGFKGAGRFSPASAPALSQHNDFGGSR